MADADTSTPGGGAAGLTPSQTVGPFLHLALADPAAWAVVAHDAPGEINVGGRILDGSGAAVPDAVVETWQADPRGHTGGTVPPHQIGESPFAPAYLGRCATDTDGKWRIRTHKPGPVPNFDGQLQAPHLLVSVFARGLLDRVITLVYFSDEPEANDADPILALLADDDRERLTAVQQPGTDVYELNIVLQGDDETPFFTV